MKFVVEKEKSLLELLGEQFPDSSKTTLRSWLEKGRVCVAGRVVKKGNARVEAGREVVLRQKTHILDLGIEVLYEDEHLAVIYKPEGVLSVATAFDRTKTAHEVLKRRFHSQRVYPVHRLDRETSGVMLFAYSEKGREGLKKQFQEHSIEREYLGIVEGKLEAKRGVWESFLQEDPDYFVRSAETGKKSITHYLVQKEKGNYTLLLFKLETGRKNQIRVHCYEAGHPLAGDKKYGAVSNPLKRLCLHAHTLGFVHPVKGEKMRFSAMLPEEFYKII